MDSAWKEDRWVMSQLLDEMKSPTAPKPLTKSECRLADVLIAPRGKLHPASILLSDYSVRRRLGGRLKEAQWMGESFAVKHFIGDFESEVALLSSVAHPNVAHAAYCFHDEERKEYYVVMDQLMSKDLVSYVKEACGPRQRVSFPLIVAVDIMLQIARGMEYLHAKKLYHGELNPSNVLVKPRQPDGYVHVKVTGYGRSGTVTTGSKASANSHADANANGGGENACIWYAPEVLDQDGAAAVKCTEKADVYSFSMICFELLTGKVPFEDKHLQGDKTSKNIRAGERPLFPFQAPKYLVSLTKRCWNADPEHRPSFASICRVLRCSRAGPWRGRRPPERSPAGTRPLTRGPARGTRCTARRTGSRQCRRTTRPRHQASPYGRGRRAATARRRRPRRRRTPRRPGKQGRLIGSLSRRARRRLRRRQVDERSA